MKKNIQFLLQLMVFLMLFTSCENYLDPNNENFISEEDLISNMSYAEGLLLSAYQELPNDYYFETDVATDDAVTNNLNSGNRRMAIGEWGSTFNPVSEWETSNVAIINRINKFLEISPSVQWALDQRLDEATNAIRAGLIEKRLRGEAYGLRAWYKLKLLQHHGGKAADGRMLGFPIINSSLHPSDDWNLPRNTIAECVASIFDDCDMAIESLPANWENKPVGPDYPEENAYFNETSGARFENRLNGNAARAIKARTALLAASPAFAEGSNVTWEEAARIAGTLLKDLGELYDDNHTFFKETGNKEILWNQSLRQIRTWEQNNFPPSQFGYGRTNPSQNLVDAFPMANGYPINHPESGYDVANPYTNRDQRFYDYIVYNGSTFSGDKVVTDQTSDLDGINATDFSTRTGYYLKKFMNESINLNPTRPTNAPHSYTLVRMTEVLLNYAEAANEAWGPDADPLNLGFTAKDKIAELRQRAGISDDGFLSGLDQDGFRDLIHNERRISLCFEGFRFWDIRRWMDNDAIDGSVKGVFISSDLDGNKIYEYRDVEERRFQPYMIYGPIPYQEIVKASNLVQNQGW